MLDTLRIQNYALIDATEIEFGPGFNVLTGETGAGKSILLGALNLVLGGRASAEVIRSGAERAHIEAIFRLQNPRPRLAALLSAQDITVEAGELMLARTVAADGRSRAYVGGRLVPVSVLAAIGDELVDLHGQHEHQSLLQADRQLELLDAYADTETEVAAMAEQVARLRALAAEIAALEQDDRERLRRMEFLRHETQEIAEASLRSGEEEELGARLTRITNAERICALAQEAYTVLYEGGEVTAMDLLDRALVAVESLGEVLAECAPLAAQLGEARGHMEAVATELRRFTESSDIDPNELEYLNQRKALLQKLKKKYGATVEDVLAYGESAMGELHALENRDQRLEALKKEAASIEADAMRAARSLSAARRKAAALLDSEVIQALQGLGMKGARFETRFEAVPLYARGCDRVEFLLAANTGENMKSLRHTASGGEISRIMLALKSVLARADAIPSLVFDEIDAGVGGAVARNVAQRLLALARSHQVLCITHLPQIAAAAKRHFHVSKAALKGRTVTTIAQVEGEGRIAELARLLDGTVSPVSLEHARQLLAKAS
jgi:DNA repair protein RecN (Recombination protein N)